MGSNPNWRTVLVTDAVTVIWTFVQPLAARLVTPQTVLPPQETRKLIDAVSGRIIQPEGKQVSAPGVVASVWDRVERVPNIPCNCAPQTPELTAACWLLTAL